MGGGWGQNSERAGVTDKQQRRKRRERGRGRGREREGGGREREKNEREKQEMHDALQRGGSGEVEWSQCWRWKMESTRVETGGW